jgi:hypothetical protein
MEMKIFENTFTPYEDLQILCMLFTSHITPHTTLGNEQCLKLLLGVCNTKDTNDLSISLTTIQGITVSITMHKCKFLYCKLQFFRLALAMVLKIWSMRRGVVYLKRIPVGSGTRNHLLYLPSCLVPTVYIFQVKNINQQMKFYHERNISLSEAESRKFKQLTRFGHPVTLSPKKGNRKITMSKFIELK